jgi:hypothetical protein
MLGNPYEEMPDPPKAHDDRGQIGTLAHPRGSPARVLQGMLAPGQGDDELGIGISASDATGDVMQLVGRLTAEWAPPIAGLRHGARPDW